MVVGVGYVALLVDIRVFSCDFCHSVHVKLREEVVVETPEFRAENGALWAGSVVENSFNF